MLTVTADKLPRFMACNGSRLMGGAMPPIEADDTVRDEGNAADWLVGQVHSGAHAAEELVDRKAPNGVYITAEMVDFLEEYLKWVSQGGHVEIDTSHAGENWQVNGRADHAVYYETNRTLYIADLKFGWSIVEPENNWTLISHAVGWFRKYGRQVDHVVFMIFQPRPHHPAGRVRSWSITGAELFAFALQIGQTLSFPNDMLNTGSHCYRCPALAICPAARKAQMNAIDTSERAFIDNIDNDNLSFQLDHLKRAIKVLEQMEDAYSELALYRLKDGQVVKNYSVENELTNRAWQDHVTPEFAQILTGKDLTKKQLITPAQAEKMGVAKEVVASLTERRQKGFKLIRVDADTKAKKLFNQPPKGN